MAGGRNGCVQSKLFLFFSGMKLEHDCGPEEESDEKVRDVLDSLGYRSTIGWMVSKQPIYFSQFLRLEVWVPAWSDSDGDSLASFTLLVLFPIWCKVRELSQDLL